jgi:hypothetical protein
MNKTALAWILFIVIAVIVGDTKYNISNKIKVGECYYNDEKSVSLKITELLKYGIKVDFHAGLPLSDLGLAVNGQNGYIPYSQLKRSWVQVDCVYE